jgi:uncharacterized protein YbjT (DUF2867 family)
MKTPEIHIVTGAFGYSGKYIATSLIEAGYEVRTLTNSPNRANPFGNKIKATPYHFENYEKLVESLQGAHVLYNTYWVRFNYRDFQYATAVRNTHLLFRAAKAAGVNRIVHISIANPSEDSPLEYYSGKAKLERALIESEISYAILRPTVLFGKEDILINNIAWMLRKFPVFGIFGDGNYRLQPIFVDDLAKLAIEQGRQTENVIIDAVGPETFTYREMVEMIGEIISKPRPIISIPDSIGYLISWVIGIFVNDVPITHDEIEGLKANLLFTTSTPVGSTKLSDWVIENSTTLGKRYTSELARRKNRLKAYENL